MGRGGRRGLEVAAAELAQQRPVDADTALEDPERSEEASAEREERRGARASAERERDRGDGDGTGVAARELHASGEGKEKEHRDQREEERGLDREREVFARERRPLGEPFGERARLAADEDVAGGVDFRAERSEAPRRTVALLGRAGILQRTNGAAAEREGRAVVGLRLDPAVNENAPGIEAAPPGQRIEVILRLDHFVDVEEPAQLLNG